MIYVILIDILYQFRLCWNDKRGHGNAVSLPRSIVGRRHCRILILGNLNSDATRIDFIRISCSKNVKNISLLFLSALRAPSAVKKNIPVCDAELLAFKSHDFYQLPNCDEKSEPESIPPKQNKSDAREDKCADCEFAAIHPTNFAFAKHSKEYHFA